MKRNLLTVLLFAFCILGNAQNKFNLSGITSLVNYGIDYSLAKVFGGKESDWAFLWKWYHYKL